MINGVGRYIPDGMKPFTVSDAFKTTKRKLISKKTRQVETVFLDTIEAAFDRYNITS